MRRLSAPTYTAPIIGSSASGRLGVAPANGADVRHENGRVERKYFKISSFASRELAAHERQKRRARDRKGELVPIEHWRILKWGSWAFVTGTLHGARSERATNGRCGARRSFRSPLRNKYRRLV